MQVEREREIKMAITTLTNTMKFKLLNTFVPYRETYTFTPADGGIIIGTTTAGQAFYYIAQGAQDVTSGVADPTYELPGNITIAATKTTSFVPYHETFTYTVNAGDSVVIPVTTVGQVLYYIKQAVDGITVSYTKAQ